MRWLYLLVLTPVLTAVWGCSLRLPGQGNPAPGAPADAPIVLAKATVAEFLVQPPRKIILQEPVDGFEAIWLNERPVGTGFENSTATYSRNGCPLAGPPIQSGDTIKVLGHLKNGALIADIIWLLDIEIATTECDGPAAD
ncbi:MAG: hypothetical protein RMK84_06580 [Oscillochloridaceae bacterium]|nr:hypothetical protein [Chloroflexaceae bacterium]MDW8389774.1 hypothetical protein [Oscillochloridaceae bacterium]